MINKQRLKEIMKFVVTYYDKGTVKANSESTGFMDIVRGVDDIEDDDEAETLITMCIKEFMSEDLKLCSCGSPERTWEVIRLVLKAQTIGDYTCTMKALSEICGVDINNNANYDGMIQFMLYVLDSHEMLEHGSSISGARLTNKGMMLLELLQMNEEMEGKSNE